MRTEIEGDQLVTYTADGTFFSSQPAETQTSPNSPEMLAQLAALGAALLADPERFAAMVAQVAGSNTAKGPLVYLADALKAAEQT